MSIIFPTWTLSRRSPVDTGRGRGTLGTGTLFRSGTGGEGAVADGRGVAVPVEMTKVRFEELVVDALDDIPDELATAMNNVVLLVEDRNPEEPELLGLYVGIALPERDSTYGGVLPDRITIYREAVLDICDTEDDVVDEVTTTVVHEIAHHFGIDDDKLH